MCINHGERNKYGHTHTSSCELGDNIRKMNWTLVLLIVVLQLLCKIVVPYLYSDLNICTVSVQIKKMKIKVQTTSYNIMTIKC